MSFLRRLPGISKVSAFVSRRALAAWSRDRAPLGPLRSLGNRLFRMAILVVRGVVAHRISMLAASLTFFTSGIIAVSRSAAAIYIAVGNVSLDD